MQQIRIKLKDIFNFGDKDFEPGSLSIPEISTQLKMVLPFLPEPASTELDGTEVVLTFNPLNKSKQDEAERLLAKGIKRAEEGSYEKAIGIFKTVLELDPLSILARRNLAMAYSESNEPEKAIDTFIDVLRIQADDKWSMVIIANLYIKSKKDYETAESFLNRALEIDEDAYALNSLAAIFGERKDFAKAIELFDRSIASTPAYINPYFGKATVLTKMDKPEEAEKVLEELFAIPKTDDIRSEIIYQQARDLYVHIQEELAQENQILASAIVNNYVSEVAEISGFPIQIDEADFKDQVGATIKMAWKYKRNYHLLTTRKGYPPILLTHLKCHELTHIKLEAEARSFGSNKFFSTTSETFDFAMKSLAPEIKKLKQQGYDDATIRGLCKTLIEGLVGFLFNCPLDMIIESNLRVKFPSLKHAQFLSVKMMALESRYANENPTIRKVAPKKILDASLALNGAYALFLDDLFQGATSFVDAYKPETTFKLSERIYAHWLSSNDDLRPGDEYRLVDEFAEMLGLTNWFSWQDDPVTYDPIEEDPGSGVTNPQLLEAKSPASVIYILSTLKRFESMTTEEIKEIGFEIALLGSQGLDYSNANKRYNLRTIPGEKFTGLQLMCLIFSF